MAQNKSHMQIPRGNNSRGNNSDTKRNNSPERVGKHAKHARSSNENDLSSTSKPKQANTTASQARVDSRQQANARRSSNGMSRSNSSGQSGARRQQGQMSTRQTARRTSTQPQSSHGFDMGTPKKGSLRKKVIIAIVVVLLIGAGLVGADIALNYGKIHHGVTVEGIDVGGMTKAEATADLQSKLDSRISTTTVTAKPNAATEERLANRAVVSETSSESSLDESGGESTEGSHEESQAAEELGSEESSVLQPSITWSFSANELGASANAASYIDEAYQVGEITGVLDFFPALAERLGAWFGNSNIEITLDFDEEALSSALSQVNDTVAIAMVNSNISIDGEGFASVQTGQIGEKVDERTFALRAEQVILKGQSNMVEVPLISVSLDIDDSEAQLVADEVNASIAEPVTFTYEESSWMAWAPLLGSWITTSVEGSGASAKLIASVDTIKAYDGLQELMGDVGYGTAQNAHIDVSSGAPVVVGGSSGMGPDIKSATQDLQVLLFEDITTAREIAFATAEVEPAVTAAEVTAMGITDLITSYQLGYGSGGGSNRELNIEKCLETLNGSIVAPGNNWNWNEIVGRCDETTGYLEAGAINEKNEIVQEAGGGICNVATGVFNAAYEAGLPIVERANHSVYMPNYPLGRDAAVSWQYPTLVFKNDTSHHILITASFDGSTMTISVWGTNEHRSVESRNSEWATTSDGGQTITNYRTVKNADDSIWFEDSFYSYFPKKS